MVLVALLPLFFLPTIQEQYEMAKWFAAVLVTLILVGMWTIRYLWTKNTTRFEVSNYTVGLFSMTIVSFVSLFFSSTNKYEALLTPMGPVAFATLTILSLVLSSLLDSATRKQLRTYIYGMASVLGLIAVYQSIGIGKSLFPAFPFLSDPLWTPTGSSLATITILVSVLPILASDCRSQIKERKELTASLLIMMALLIVSGLGVTIWKFIPKIGMTILPLSTGWAITLDTLKSAKQATIGIGAENFLTAFNIGRPVSYNMSPLWNIRFTSNASFLLHVTTVYGLLGFGASLLMLKSLIPRQLKSAESISLIICMVALIFTPPSLAVLLTITVLTLVSPHAHTREMHMGHIHPIWAKGILAFLAFGLLGFGVFLIGREYMAQRIFYTSLQKAKENNGTETYNLQIQAIGLSKYVSVYHLIYSQTNLALAISLTNAMNQPSANQTPEQKVKDQQLVAQLIQQSIREAKLATTLNPQSVLAWENLARIYNQLIDVAQGADAWTIASYQKAIELDPNNPILRFELGSVAMKQKKYPEAITLFQKSASLKPNYANAYYNLAYAYKEMGDDVKALETLRLTKTLIDSSSPDWEKITKDIESLEQKK